MSHPLQKPLKALPGYFGSKRRLLSWIGQTLDKAIPASQWPQTTFIDLFLGGGAVSLWAKAQGFSQVASNDISLRSQLIGQAFLNNQRVKLTRAEVLGLTVPLAEAGFIEQTYCSDVFSRRHAKALDSGFAYARSHPDATHRALLMILLWHLANDFVCFSSSMGTSNRPYAEALDGLRGWDGINPKRFTDGSLKSLCQPTWAALEAHRKRVNAGVFGGSPVTLYQEDALTLLPKLSGDILYLDPPYADTASYELTHRVLDSLLAGQMSEAATSGFSQSVDLLNPLLESARHIPIWCLSYGSKAVSLDELTQLVKAHAGGRTVKGFAKRFTHMRHVSKSLDHQELLVLAY